MVFELLELPDCSVLRCERWDAPRGRWFVAYRARHGYRWLLGNGVVDEFATVSSPIFIAPQALLGVVYNAGISFGHRRDADMAIDFGWPPLCAGVDRPASGAGGSLEKDLLALLTGSATPAAPGPELRTTVGGYELERWRFHDEVTVIGTDAPLLPQQLGRLCDTDTAPLTIALATGNRVTRQQRERPQEIKIASDEAVQNLVSKLAEAG